MSIDIVNKPNYNITNQGSTKTTDATFDASGRATLDEKKKVVKYCESSLLDNSKDF